jgi:hypothetical protein
MLAYRALIFLAFVIVLPRGIAQVDTIACGDTLQASYTANVNFTPTDSFYVWIGNCQPVVKFDFHTLDVPDGADMFYVDINGNKTSAGSIPYFGGNCTSGNYFTNPSMFNIFSSLSPNACLPGFVEMYGAGIPFHDSVVQRTAKPADFKLPGAWQECARLHLNIPPGTVAVLFVIKFNPNQTTILNALWDCTPNCCIVAEGDTVCAGETAQLGTDREAFSYSWTGPNGFSSTAKEPIIPNATQANEGWYYLQASYLFGCNAYDSVFLQVHSPEAVIQPDTAQICSGSATSLSAIGSLSYQWIQNSSVVTVNGNTAIVAPSITTSYTVIGSDVYGCSDTTTALVIPTAIDIQVDSIDVSCFGQNDGQIQVTVLDGQAPYQIRIAGGNWLSGTTLNSLVAGNYQIEVMDAAGCLAQGQITVNEPPALAVTTNSVAATCKNRCDGEISITASGGIAPYQYQANGQTINSIASGLCADNYDLIVSDANGCLFHTSLTINEPEAVDATIDIEDISCHGLCDGGINITSTGGTAPYQFTVDGQSVNATANDFCAGNFELMVNDANGCAFQTSFTIEEPELLTATVDASPVNCQSSCNGTPGNLYCWRCSPLSVYR